MSHRRGLRRCGRTLEAAALVVLVSICTFYINKYYVYNALVCSHCNDGRGMANSAVFAMCRLSLSFLVYSPSHSSLQTRYHTRTHECWTANFLARADQPLAGGPINEYRTAPGPPGADRVGVGRYHSSALWLPHSFRITGRIR